MHEWKLRLRALFQRSKLDRDLDDELQFHLAMKQELGPVRRPKKRDGRLEIRRAFGNAAAICGVSCRSKRCGRISATPAVCCAATPPLRSSQFFRSRSELAGTLAIFTLAHASLLKSLPVTEPDRLRLLTWVGGEDVPADSVSGYGDYDRNTHMQSSGSFSYPAYLEMRSKLADLGEVFAFRWTQVSAATQGLSEVVPAQMVSGNYFEALGASVWIGRTIQSEGGNQPNAPAAAVISHRLSGSGASEQACTVLGDKVSLNGAGPSRLSASLPPAQVGVQPGEKWSIFTIRWRGNRKTAGRIHSPTIRRLRWAQMFARLRPGVSSAQFRSPPGDVIFPPDGDGERASGGEGGYPAPGG